LLCLANTAFWLGLLPIGHILLPTQLATIDAVNKVSNLAIVTAIGALTALIPNPIAGALSDRTTSRLGRRRAWFVFGTALSAITLALMATASTIATLVVWWALFHIAANAVLAALAAVIPDRVPVRQRATVSAFVSLSLPLGAVIGVILVTRIVKTTQLSYYVLASILFVVMTLFMLLVRDKPLPRGFLPRFSLAAFLA